MSISIPVNALFNKNKEALEASGITIDVFDGLSFADAKALIAEYVSPASTAPAAQQQPATGTVAGQGNTAQSIDTKEYLSVPYEERVYGTGRDRKVYKNAKLFNTAYANIDMTLNGKEFKLGAINLQDLGETNGVDAGTKRGRAMLLRTLKALGIEGTEGVATFSISLNIPEIMDGAVGDDEFEEFLEAAVASSVKE